MLCPNEEITRIQTSNTHLHVALCEILMTSRQALLQQEHEIILSGVAPTTGKRLSKNNPHASTLTL